MEVSLILAKMVWNFDWALHHPDPKFEQQKVYALWQKSELKLELTERNLQQTR